MSNDSTGRTPRTSGGSAPMGSTVAIVVTAVALILGFLILRKVNDSGTNSAPATTKPSATSAPASTAAPGTTAAPTTSTVAITATKVQVANASNASGVAKSMTEQLKTKGYSMAEPTNATVSPKLDISKVLYNADDPNSKGVADSVATLLGGIKVEKGGSALPVKSGTWAAGSGVIVMLGNDLAGKTLAEIGGGTNATPTPVTT